MDDWANTFPPKLESLHRQEEQLRVKALEIIAFDRRLKLHIAIVESAMDIADLFRQLNTNDEDLKVVQVLGMRMFNALGASLKLALSGYHQNSALILRDVLETVFLVDLFAGDRTQIEIWRAADKQRRIKDFKPVKVREKLDTRDGFKLQRRAEIYDLFSELAGHPTMKSNRMMQPQKDGDVVIGPFMEVTTLEAVISEMGRIAIQVREVISSFLPDDLMHEPSMHANFKRLKLEWIAIFYPDLAKKTD